MDSLAYVKSILSLVLVLGLVLGLLWALRRFAPAGMVARPQGRRRLAVVESLSLDGKRRLVLVRRDDAEHLLVLGGGTDLVVETGIRPAGEGEGA